MKIKIRKIKVAALSALIKKMLLMDSSIYINFDSQRVWSSVYIPSKDVVKVFETPIEDIFEFENKLEEVVKLSFFSGSKLLSCLSYFDPHHISAEISLFRDNEDGFLYGDKITFRDQRLKIDVHCQDISLGFTSMTDAQVKMALNRDTAIYDFQLSREDLTKITQLMTLDRDARFEIYQDLYGVHIKTEAFDCIVDDTKTSQDKTSKFTFKTFLERIDKETYEVTVCENKLLMKSTETTTNIALNLTINE